jgi:uncharacterized protein YegJ (DUF2314 family)
MPFARMPNLVQTTSLALVSSLLCLSMGAAHAEPAVATKPAASQKAAAPKADTKAEEKQEVVELNDKDPAMKAAFKKAQGSLDGFLKVHASNDPNIDVESVRVRLTEGKVTEYVWVHPFEKDGNGYKGKANSVPSRLSKLVVGGQVSFKREDIVDWTYFEIKARRMHGNFTTCVQLAKAPAAEVEALKKAYGLDCSKNL